MTDLLLFAGALGERVQLVRAASTIDPFSGEPEVSNDWAAAVVVADWPNVVVMPESAGDAPTLDRPNRSVDRLTAYLPYGAQARTTDRLRVVTGLYAGDWLIDDDVPAHLRHPITGWTPASVVNLRRVTG